MSARVRIGRVKLKRDGKVVLLRKPEDHRAAIADCVNSILNGHGTDIAGMAFVVWGSDMQSTADMKVFGNPIPTMLVPDFVRNRLLAERIETWTLEALRRETK